MTMILPTLKQLEYLVAVAETGHFGRAAERCNVTQSTLSAGVAELERLLAATLIERGRRVSRLTPAGEAVVARAHRVLREAEELAQAALAQSEPLSGTLRLGVIPTIAPFLLPRVLPGLRARYPDLKLFLREELSGPACESLAKGALDAVLLALPWPCGDFETEPLFEDPVWVAFAPGDFPDPPPTIAPGALAAEQLLLLEDGHCFRNHSLAACGRPELQADRMIMGTSLHTLVQMVDNRLGMTLVPRMALDAGILHGTRVEARPIEGAPARTIALAWRSTSPRAEEFRLLAVALRDGAASIRRTARAAVQPAQPPG
ncbi:MAG: hydrogen peroxide-inducible genes activator [Thermaurantiacus sp.]